MVKNKTFDCIVLGAGPAGLAAARGLSLRFPDARIALIEQGLFPQTYSSRFSVPPLHLRCPALQRVPLLQPYFASTGLGRYSLPSVFRDYRSRDEPGVAQGRSLQYVSGRGVGGSSLVCNMKAVRPTQMDCEKWGPGWSWEELFPFFHETVRCLGDPSEVFVLNEGRESSSAPLATVRRSERSLVDSALNVRFYEACEAAGLQSSTSFNQGTADGFSFYESHVTKGAHERGMLYPEVSMHIARNSFNDDDRLNGITLFLNTRAQRVLMEGAQRARRVECSSATTGRLQNFEGKHIIVALGALESPAFLLRSGIGPGGPIVDLPGVGKNLITSTSVSIEFSMKADPTTNAMMTKSLDWRHARHIYQQWKEYKESGSGIFSVLCEGGAFLSSDPGEVPFSDLSIDFYRHPIVLPGEASMSRFFNGLLHPMGVSFVCTHHYPRSRGWIRLSPLRSSSSFDNLTDKSRQRNKLGKFSNRKVGEGDDLEVKFGIYSDEEKYDLNRMDHGLQWISRISSPTLPSVYYSGERQQPVSPFYHLGMKMTRPNKSLTSEEQVHNYLKEHTVLSSSSLYGTCSLGSVVNHTDLSVKGTDGLYVADASVIPTPTVASSWLLSAAIGARVSTFF